MVCSCGGLGSGARWQLTFVDNVVVVQGEVEEKALALQEARVNDVSSRALWLG